MPTPTEACVQECLVTSDARPSDPRAALAATAGAVARAADLDVALGAILAAAKATVDPVLGVVVIQDPDRADLAVAASIGLDAEGEAALTRVMTDPAHPFRVAAAERTTTFDRESVLPTGKPWVGSYLPLLASDGGVEITLGVLGFGWVGPRTLDEDEREALEGFAGLASLAVERARLASTAAERSDWFERLAHSDPLTGLANERTVGRMLELELARAGRQGGEVSLAMFDIDDFQVTNRDGGHAAGDDVLRRVAAVLADSVRLVDTVGRVGGDEFVLIAPGSAGITVANRVLAGIAALPAVAGKTVSVSAGVARFPVDGGDAESLIESAKAALARAKADGQGQVAAGTAAEA
jgi:diguanylate cyclase (GGDEF)-like protein